MDNLIIEKLNNLNKAIDDNLLFNDFLQLRKKIQMNEEYQNLIKEYQKVLKKYTANKLVKDREKLKILKTKIFEQEDLKRYYELENEINAMIKQINNALDIK